MNRVFAAAAAIAMTIVSSAALAWDVPELKARVNDGAELMTPEQRSQLESKLTAFEQSTGHQFAFLSVASLGGVPVEEFGVKTASAWKLGDKKRDDGLLFLVSKGDRKIRIEVGYGLEGVVPDAVASRVIRETIGPAFKRGDWVGGVNAGFDALIAATKPADTAASEAATPSAKATAKKATHDAENGLEILLAVLGSVFVMVLFSVRRDRKKDERERELSRKFSSYSVSENAHSYEPVTRTYTPVSERTYVPVPVPIPVRSDPETVRRRRDDDDSYRSRNDDNSSSVSTSSFFDDSSSSSGGGFGGGFDGGGGGFGGGGASGDF